MIRVTTPNQGDIVFPDHETLGTTPAGVLTVSSGPKNGTMFAPGQWLEATVTENETNDEKEN